MQYLGLVFIVLMYLPITISNKITANETEDTIMLFKNSAFRSLLGIAVGVISFVLSGAALTFDTNTILISLLFGIALGVCMVATFYAMQLTTMTTVYLFMIGATMISCVVGAVFFNEPFTIYNAIGLVILFVALYLVVGKSGEEKKKFGFKAFIACLLVFLTTGLGDVSFQLFAKCTQGVNESVFMLYSYIFQAIILVIVYYIFRAKEIKAKPDIVVPKLSAKLIIWGFVGVAVAYIGQQVTALLAGAFDALVLFPLKNGSSIVVASIVGAVFFKEKLTVKSIVGIIISILAITMINVL